MDFKEIHGLLISLNNADLESGAKAIFKALDKPFIKHFEGQWRLANQEAVDLNQESLITIIKKAPMVNEPEKFEAWCWTVAKNKARDYLRKTKREKDFIEFNSDKYVDESTIENINSEQSDNGDCVREGYGQFALKNSNHAYALDLQQDGYSIKDIATRIDRTPAATKEYLSQCRKKLKTYIKHCMELD
ncbi:MAG: RNA polymerase sigma factor [Nitrosomonadales bacterium]|jgi:RNA polymerase sigma-70 factor (ECF subfamily)|uniref:RNA polymerase sigma-70 factor, ECF subfamily protein n=1 Tax=Methylophilales bacterium HTCC2181 TaxID=383631 RepID=A0P518_9PROT|nr:RNA polymerase sigma-70 factor, ECF subfamily protein [Methylophilales bacterium HTCC2181]MBT3513201.1 RNA polymerase sigma factor [Nitrosomonadales bacterium]MBT5968037.1 RNA polymerase sigma factor [Nitrospina sp.]MCH9781967.1 RNA polymerase sigma factor [Betaproteobacteria bacterium]MDA9087636.1 RNA polymerase sigma factor [Methylophilaceae bacterium]